MSDVLGEDHLLHQFSHSQIIVLPIFLRKNEHGDYLPLISSKAYVLMYCDPAKSPGLPVTTGDNN